MQIIVSLPALTIGLSFTSTKIESYVGQLTLKLLTTKVVEFVGKAFGLVIVESFKKRGLIHLTSLVPFTFKLMVSPLQIFISKPALIGVLILTVIIVLSVFAQ